MKRSIFRIGVSVILAEGVVCIAVYGSPLGVMLLAVGGLLVLWRGW